ncbi:MAG: hypothetical protein LBU18_04330 [Treponema sp.]|jgi:hypothetical protein|nr:hypothetical protein [Treponema sp.]
MYVPRNEKNLLYAGLAAFGILFGGSLAMILTGCSYPSAPGAAQGADPAALFQDADGLVAVTVPLPAGGGGGQTL